METLRSFIDGAPFAGGGETIDNINPANGEPVCRIELADEAVVEAAVEAAKRGFEVWKNTPSFERGRVLMRAAALLRARNDELAKIEMTDTGKPISESLAVDIESAAEAIEYYGGLAPRRLRAANRSARRARVCPPRAARRLRRRRRVELSAANRRLEIRARARLRQRDDF